MGQLFVLAVVSTASAKEQLSAYFSGGIPAFCKIFMDSGNESIDYIREHPQDFDVVISCASKYQDIVAATDKPVVRIDISFQDILRSLLMAQNYSGDLVFVGSSTLAQTARDASELLQVKVETVSLNSYDKLNAALNILKEDGFGVVLGDEFVSAAAQEAGFANITVVPGASSITSAAALACTIANTICTQEKQLELIKSALFASEFLIVIFSEDGKLLYTSANSAEDATVLQLINSQPLDALPKKSMLKDRSDYWSVEKQHLYLKAERVVCLFIQKQHYDLEDTAMRGITIATHSDLSKHEISEGYLDSVPSMRKIIDEARNYAKLSSPTIIFGEAGVGKNIFANIIHKYSHYSDNHVVVVDCELVELPTWTKLLHEPTGIFSENDVVYYFKNYEQAPAQIQDMLNQHLSYMESNGRNKLIFSCNCLGCKPPIIPMTNFLIDKLHASWIYVPPLRERTAEFGSLSSIYINSLGVELGSQVIGLEPTAIPLLKEYNWPGNLNQFRRFIAELMVSSKGYYISPKTVSLELAREMAENTPEKDPHLPGGFDLSGDLEDIEKRIISAVLQEEGQNQTTTAKRLGISRSTLWRKLKT